jgi:hypothetical protein
MRPAIAIAFRPKNRAESRRPTAGSPGFARFSRHFRHFPAFSGLYFYASRL